MLDAEFYRIQWMLVREENAYLAEENTRLKERIAAMENQDITLGMRITSALGGQPQVGRTLAVLIRMSPLPVTREAMENVIHQRPESDRAKLLDVNICKARKLLRTIGYDDAIVTIWGHGYQIRKDAKAALMQLIERHESVNGQLNIVLREIPQCEEFAA